MHNRRCSRKASWFKALVWLSCLSMCAMTCPLDISSFLFVSALNNWNSRVCGDVRILLFQPEYNVSKHLHGEIWLLTSEVHLQTPSRKSIDNILRQLHCTNYIHWIIQITDVAQNLWKRDDESPFFNFCLIIHQTTLAKYWACEKCMNY